MNATLEQERRRAVTRLTSGETEAVPVLVHAEDGTEQKITLDVHEYARMIPVITPGDLDRLLKDVEDNGLREPLVLYQGRVLDGRNRLAVASVLGVPVQTREFTGSDEEARSYVWSANAARRHLSIPQILLAATRFGFLDDAKAEAAAKQETNPDGSMQHGGARWAAIAVRRLGTSVKPGTVERFDEAQVMDAPDTVRKIDQGEIRRVDIAVKEAVGERSFREGRVIEIPPPVPRSPWDSLGCARSDVLRAERSIRAGNRGIMSQKMFAERAREIQAALIHIQEIYKYGDIQDRR